MSITLANGTYPGKANGHTHMAPEGKVPYVNVPFKLSGGQGIVYWKGYMNEKNEARTVEALLAAGWTGQDWEHLPGLGSKEVNLVVENEADERPGHEGKMYPKVRYVNDMSRTAGVKEEDKMKPAELKGFAARMEALAKAAKQGETAAAPAASKDSLPF